MAFIGASIESTDTTPGTYTFDDTTVLIGCLVSNAGEENVTVDVLIRDMYLLRNTSIPRGSSLVALQGKIVAANSEQLRVVVHTVGGTVHTHISMLDEV